MESNNETFGVDESGVILTEVSFDKVTPEFKAIVETVLNQVVQEFAPQLDGFYLYGSVVTGKAIRGKSDLDTTLVLKDEPTKELLEKISNLGKRLSKQYEAIFREIGTGVTYIDELCSEKERFGGLCFMKHLSVCIYGNDLTKDVMGFKPTKEVAKGFNGDIGNSLESLRTKIGMAISESETKKLSQSMAKKVLRTGFSLVMPRLRSWTTDLQTSCDAFARYYPQKAKEMNVALNWSKHGSPDKQAAIEFIDTFGKWLTKEFDREILAN